LDAHGLYARAHGKDSDSAQIIGCLPSVGRSNPHWRVPERHRCCARPSDGDVAGSLPVLTAKRARHGPLSRYRGETVDDSGLIMTFRFALQVLLRLKESQEHQQRLVLEQAN